MGSTSLDRRDFMMLAAGAAAAPLFGLKAAFAAGPDRPSLVLVILRGGMDGLAAIGPHGDPGYRRARTGLAIARPGEADGFNDLDGFFGLHPAMTQGHALYRRGELIAMIGVASPYRGRSHFDAQDMLENGTAETAGSTGWLNRAMPAMGLDGMRAISVGGLVPLLLRGDAPVASWMPAVAKAPDETFLSLMDSLYATDDILGPAWHESRATDRMLDIPPPGRPDFEHVCAIAARMMNAENGPRVVSLEVHGWDMHSSQGAATGRLERLMGGLDRGLGRLASDLTPERWKKTAILAVSEFGRTVHMNGTGGTDHGTGGAAFLLGGAVDGGRVLHDWRGLEEKYLYEQRDLHPAIDLRAVFKSVLHDHMKIGSRTLETKIFPDSSGTPATGDLIRA
ncbi:MAG: hypothetical protein AMXMBFR74_12020 [Parvibaculum sp.]|uniref:DUF1501 domain-containing protein n=1 Tax=Parvibaculum sp. TaxID=2024848 RepID=UPI0035B9C712